MSRFKVLMLMVAVAGCPAGELSSADGAVDALGDGSMLEGRRDVIATEGAAEDGSARDLVKDGLNDRATGDLADGPLIVDSSDSSACVRDCTGRACGPDPLCGLSCGSCGDRRCTAAGQCGAYLWMHDAVTLTPPAPSPVGAPEYMKEFPVVFAQENKSLSPVANFGYLAAVDAQAFSGAWDNIAAWQTLYPNQTFAVWHISFEYQAASGNIEPGHTGKGLLFDGVTESSGEEITGIADAKWYGARGVFAGHWLYRAGTYTTSALDAAGTSVKVASPTALEVGSYVVIRKGRRRAPPPPGGDWRNYAADGEWSEAEFAKVSAIGSDGTITLSERGYSGSRGAQTSARVAHPTGSYIAHVVEGQAGVKTWRWNCARDWCPLDKSAQTMNDWLTRYYWDTYRRIGGTGQPIAAATRVGGFFWDIDDSDLSSPYHGPPDVNNDGTADGGWDPVTGANRYGQGQKDFNQGLVQYFVDHPHPLTSKIPFVYMGAIGSETDRGACGYQAEQAFMDFDIYNPDPAANNKYRGYLDEHLCRLKWQVGRVGHGPAGSQVLLKNATVKYSTVKGTPVAVPTAKGEQTARFSLAMATVAGAAFSHMNWYTDGDRFHDEYAVDRATASTATTNPQRYAQRFWLGKPLDTYYRVEGADAKYALARNVLTNPFFELNSSEYSTDTGTISRTTQSPWPGNAHGVSLHFEGPQGAALMLPTHSFVQGKWYTLSIAARADLSAPSCDGALKKISLSIAGAAAKRSVFVGPEWSVVLVSFLWNRASANSSIRLQMGNYACPASFGAFLLFEDTNANIFRRDFEHGSVLVNATESPVTIGLARPHHHIKGIIDPTFNNGAKNVMSVTLGKYDARFIVRP